MTAPRVPAIVDFSGVTAAAEVTQPAAGRLLAGNPVQSVGNLFSDATGQFHAGIWTSTPGKWRVHYTENEFCHLLEGSIRITDAEGNAWSFLAGASFVIPAGFTGIWEVIDSARKLYAIFEPTK